MAKKGNHLLRNRKCGITPQHNLKKMLIEEHNAALGLDNKPLGFAVLSPIANITEHHGDSVSHPF